MPRRSDTGHGIDRHRNVQRQVLVALAKRYPDHVNTLDLNIGGTGREREAALAALEDANLVQRYAGQEHVGRSLLAAREAWLLLRVADDLRTEAESES